jgi:ribonuclease HII
MDETLSQPALLAAPPSPCRRCGLDEVGRGALAGPLVAAAVILPDDFTDRLGPLVRFLRDSKTVSPARRRDLATAIRQHALALEIAAIGVAAINAHGIGWANREAFRLLIGAVSAHEYVVDGKVRPPIPAELAARVRCFPKADATVPAVSAASLVAKVYRDDLMAGLHSTYPHFGWDSNAGYAAPIHLAALRTHGPCPEHRAAFVATVFAGGQRARREKTRRPAAPELPLG